MTRRTLVATLLVVPFVCGLFLGQGQDPLAGRTTPDLELLTVDGEAFTLDMGARDTVLYVIAPGTPACEQNLENMQALWQAKRGQFRFVAVSVKLEGLKTDAASRRLPFPVYAFRNHRDPAIGSYGFGAFPAVYVTSARTRTIQRAWGGVFRDGKLRDVETFFGVRLPGPTRQERPDRGLQPTEASGFLQLSIATSAGAQATHSFAAPISDRQAGAFYGAISFMSLGPARPAPPDRRLRVVVYLSEVYDSLSIEEVTFGEEGCCARVDVSRDVDLGQVFKAFGMSGEVSGFTFVKWLSPSSFAFTLRGRNFILTNAGTATVSIAESR